MHPALTIPEVVRRIFEEIDLGFEADAGDSGQYIYDEGGLGDLLLASLTCKLFLEPGLDSLWYRVDTLLPLFKLLSNFQEDASSSYLYGDISTKSLERFKFYARRIRVYHRTSTDPEDGLSAGAYLQVQHALRQSYVLPNLKHLYIHDEDSDAVFFVSPVLRSLYVHQDLMESTHPGHLWSAVDAARRFGKITDLSISLNLVDNHIPTPEQFPALKTLLLSQPYNAPAAKYQLNAKQIVALATSNSLQQLTFAGFLNISSCLSLMVRDPVHTSQLTHISFELVILSLAPLVQVFQSLMFPNLVELKIGFDGDLTAFPASESELWPQLFSVLSTSTHTPFKSLSLNGSSASNKAETWLPLRVSLPDLLSSQSLNLSTFDASIPLFTSLQSSKLSKLCNSWPDLQELTIHPCSAQRMSLSSFIRIAIDLTGLRKLNTSADLKECKISTVPLLVPRHGLRVFRLTDSSLNDALKFAQCIDKLFPLLETWFFSAPASHPNSQKRWAQVGPTLEVLKAARKDEADRVGEECGSRGEGRDR